MEIPSENTRILVITTGGTFDKVYFDAKSTYEVGKSIVGRLLEQAAVRIDVEITELLRKDSLELTAQDRELIRATVAESDASRIVITHGTDTMTETAAALADIPDKVIVLTGALAPARFQDSDAFFNLGMAIGAVQVAAPGTWIAMNGTIFGAGQVRKDRAQNAFVAIEVNGAHTEQQR